jgi:hypothetical protein
MLICRGAESAAKIKKFADRQNFAKNFPLYEIQWEIELFLFKIFIQKISPAANKFSKIFPTGRSRTRLDSAPLQKMRDFKLTNKFSLF